MSEETEENIDEQYLVTLRPKCLEEYIGQQPIRHNLLISLEAAKKTQRAG
jgi:Holliday junction resolvasome RuvABC ATP-dependent DNA helicase subunit